MCRTLFPKELLARFFILHSLELLSGHNGVAKLVHCVRTASALRAVPTQ